MTLTPVKLFAPSQLPNSAPAGGQYTSPGNVSTIIKKLTFTPTSASAIAVTVYLVPSGGSPANGNVIAYQIVVQAAPSRAVELTEAEGQVLNPGDYIAAFAGTANTVTMQGAGIQVTP